MNTPPEASADGRRRDSGGQWDLSLTRFDLRDHRTKVPLAEPAKPRESSPFISNHKPRRNQKNETDTNVIQDISAIALLALIAGCATSQTSTQSKESMLVASGFKAITPKTAAQQQKLQTLPPGKIAMIKKAGKTYYIFPDAAHYQAYVGGPQEYQAYQQLRATNRLEQENLETAELYQDATMNWGAWRGSGAGWGPMGMGMG
jgi:hypothetical protein